MRRMLRLQFWPREDQAAEVLASLHETRGLCRNDWKLDVAGRVAICRHDMTAASK